MSDEEEDKLKNALMSQLTDRQLKKMQNPNLDAIWTRRQIQDAFLETFELVGGVNRLAIWANESGNYAMFLKLLMTFAPKEEKGSEGPTKIEYRSNVPSSSLVKKAGALDKNVAEGEFVEIGDEKYE